MTSQLAIAIALILLLLAPVAWLARRDWRRRRERRRAFGRYFR